MDTPKELPALDLPDQIKLLQAHAEDLIRSHQHEDAQLIFEQIIQAAPSNLTALRYLAGRAIERQDFGEAKKLINKAIQASPRKPGLYQNLAVVLRAEGNLEEALNTYNTSLGLNLQQPLTWIQRGDVLQALGRNEDATASYFYAARISGNLGILGRANNDNPQLQKTIRRAAQSLIREREKFIASATDDIQRDGESGSLDRAIMAGRHMARAIPPAYADPLQRPAFCYFPGLEPKPFYDRKDFPFLKPLEDSTKAIRAELETVLSAELPLEPYVKIDAEDPAQWKTLNYSPQWSSYHLYRNGQRVPEHCEQCPETTRIIESLPLAEISGQAPEVFFSILKPGTRIPPHYGIANYKLAVHLPLIVPDSCAIRVGDLTKSWSPGKCLIFDDSYEHEAWNHSKELRVVLILEVWNPKITVGEKKYLNGAIEGLKAFERDMEKLLSKA